MKAIIKYRGDSGQNQGGIAYFYMRILMSFQKLSLQEIQIDPPQTGSSAYNAYMNVFDKSTMQYLGSSTNSTKTTNIYTSPYWQFDGSIVLEKDKEYLFTFSTTPSQNLTGLYATRMGLWPAGDQRASGSTSYPGTEIVYYPGMVLTGEAITAYGGSVEVGQGYCNVDGTNKIIFSNTVKKDFNDIGGMKGFKNNVVLTLDNSDVSSFILQGVEAGEPTGYKAIKALDKFVYLSNNKDRILGDSSKEGLEISLARNKTSYETIGNPTISADYIASNFTNSDYLQLPEAFKPQNNPWEVVAKVNSNDMSGEQYLFGSYSSGYLKLGITDGRPVLLLSTNSSSWSIGEITSSRTISAGSWYYIKATFTGSQYILSVSTDGSSYDTVGSVNSSTSVVTYSNTTLGNGNLSYGGQRFKGSIDLKECYVKINEVEWWRGAEVIAPSFSTVGSPVISEDKEASSFSNNDYLVTTENLPVSFKEIEFGLHIRSGNGTGSHEDPHFEVIMATQSQTNGFMIYNDLSYPDRRLSLIFGGNYSLGICPSLPAETEVWVKGKINKNLGRVFSQYSFDGIHYNNYEDYAWSSVAYAAGGDKFVIGKPGYRSTVPYESFKGSVFLEDCYVRVDGKDWWRGFFKNTLSLSEGYAYADETSGNFVFDTETVFNGKEILVHPEDFETARQIFVQPEFTSSTTYGVVTDSRNNVSESQEGWRVFQNTSSRYSPLREGGWWKWELPEPMTLVQGESSITVVGYSTYATRNIRFFADINKTIPITAQTAVNSTASQTVEIPVTNTVTTSIIYLEVGSSSTWSEFTKFTFNSCYTGMYKAGYLSLANPSGFPKLIATGMQNPTKDYTESVATPVSLGKKITATEDLSEILTVEDV